MHSFLRKSEGIILRMADAGLEAIYDFQENKRMIIKEGSSTLTTPLRQEIHPSLDSVQ